MKQTLILAFFISLALMPALASYGLSTLYDGQISFSQTSTFSGLYYINNFGVYILDGTQYNSFNFTSLAPISSYSSTSSNSYVSVVNKCFYGPKFYTCDGSTWNLLSYEFSSVAYGNGQYMAISSDGTQIYSSTDGQNFTSSLTTNTTYGKIEFFNGEFILYGEQYPTATFNESVLRYLDPKLPTNYTWHGMFLNDDNIIGGISNSSDFTFTKNLVDYEEYSISDLYDNEPISFGVAGQYFFITANVSSESMLFISNDGDKWHPIDSDGLILSNLIYFGDNQYYTYKNHSNGSITFYSAPLVYYPEYDTNYTGFFIVSGIIIAFILGYNYVISQIEKFEEEKRNRINAQLLA